MGYRSVDALQNTLAESFFGRTESAKKAAGRALGTLVELITFYTLRAWDFRDHVVIERKVPEFGNPGITHNVEFSLHPIKAKHQITLDAARLPLTPRRIASAFPELRGKPYKSSRLLSTDSLLNNACVLADDASELFVGHLDLYDHQRCVITVARVLADPFAIFECKRVGVEEGLKRGPQTIEKAKQGAYVARAVSSLQKIRLKNGRFEGVLPLSNGKLKTGPYWSMLNNIIGSTERSMLEDFVLTIGVVSNHGNWFTSDDPNKELRVLAQSYDWLLFLNDDGLAQFVEELS